MPPTTLHTPSCTIPNDVQRTGLPLIHAEGLSMRFHGKTPVTAVKNLNFGIQTSEITAIIGESGSGKSTLLRLLYGLLAPDEGTVRYRGWRVPPPSEKLIPGHEAMRMVSQGFDDLNTYANVWDNVASQLSNTDLDAKYAKTTAVLKQLRISPLAKQRVVDLSGGEKQRVAIARALVNEPEVLLMDEPFNQVDASFREVLQHDIRSIVRDTGVTVVLVSHDPAEVLSTADKLLVLKKGHLAATGEAAQLYKQPPNAYTARLLAQSNILDAEQAALLGIKADSPVAVHPEWITLRNSSSPFRVLDARFKGFYEVLTIGNGQFEIHVQNQAIGTLPLGTQVSIQIDQYHPLAGDSISH